MKKTIFLVIFICGFISILFSKNKTVSKLEKIYEQSLNICDKKEVNTRIDYIIKKLEGKLFNKQITEKEIFLLARVYDYKYGYLEKIKDADREKLKSFLNICENLIKKNKNSLYINYSLAIIYGRYGESINLLDAAREGIADKIKKYGEKIYKIDKAFYNYNILLLLGRLHYKTPFIPLILTWPDKNKSKKYIKEYLEINKTSLIGKYFFADTLWDLGEKEKAKKLYYEVINTKISNKNCLKNKKIINECKKRINFLGIKND